MRQHEEEGATAVEYGLIVTFVAAAVMASVAAFGHKLHVVFVAISRALPK